MRKKMLRALSFVMAAVLLTAGLPLGVSASGSSESSTKHADQLNALGLFHGTEKGYELNSRPDRTQGIVMLIRLLGKESEALGGSWQHPFADVSGWSEPYIGYAYENGLTSGVDSTHFGGSGALAPRDYVTFLLRALGYDDKQGQFTWQNSLSFAYSIGMTTQSGAISLSQVSLNRGDMVDLSYAALPRPMADGSGTLAEKLVREGVFTTEQGRAAGVIGGTPWVYNYVAQRPATAHEVKTFKTSSGSVTADVVTVNLADPSVRVEAKLVRNTVGATDSFANIAAGSGAKVVVNANFFNSEASFKAPIGSIISGGAPLHLMSGYTTMGLTANGEVRWGRPSLAVWFKGPETTTKHWIARSVNVSPTHHTEGYSVLYTPAYGKTVTVSCKGYAIEMKGANNVVSNYYAYAPGQSIAIPADGSVLLLGTALTELYLYQPPAVGTALTAETICFTEDAEGFNPAGVVTAVAGAPRLVKNGAACNETDPNFEGAKFTTLSTPRTALGTTADGRMILLSCSSATVAQLREVMLQLGCTNAVNLDGGGSCAMYYDGKTLHTPGRQLTATLQVFVD